jgi:uncharacterized membrane protein
MAATAATRGNYRSRGNRGDRRVSKTRLEAFSDAVIAIIITIMVLELKAPHGTELAALRPLAPVFLSYVLSFLYLAIYWNNHHHMLHASERVSGSILWANTHLLFWLSLIPFATAWLGETGGGAWPAALYGLVLLMAAIAYRALQFAIVRRHGHEASLAQAIGRDRKGALSVVLYAAAIALAFVAEWLAYAVYVAMAAVWAVPDRRIESRLDPRSGV